MTDMLKRD